MLVCLVDHYAFEGLLFSKYLQYDISAPLNCVALPRPTLQYLVSKKRVSAKVLWGSRGHMFYPEKENQKWPRNFRKAGKMDLYTRMDKHTQLPSRGIKGFASLFIYFYFYTVSFFPFFHSVWGGGRRVWKKGRE